MKKPRICLVNYEQGRINGILTKHAREMERVLIDEGYDVSISSKPNKNADINHHINYISAQDTKTLNTTMVTHFTSDMYKMREKLDKVRKFLINGIGICFSQGVLSYLVKQGMPRNKLRVVLPAHDGMKRRPKIIAIAFKVYPDGRKREEMFKKLVCSLKKEDRDKFIFRIMGEGWKPLLDSLPKDSPSIAWVDHFESDLYQELLNSSDFMLYTGGEDAIAQSIVDAKNAGLRIIAPKQEDVEIDLIFNNQIELNKIFSDLAYNPVENWTWENYTKQHINIWNEMYAKKSKT